MSQLELRERDGARFILGAALTSYPAPDFLARVRALSEAAEASELSALIAALEREGAVDALRGDYIDLFDRQEGHVPLYETEYGRARAVGKGHALADLAGFYRAFGVSVGGMEDEGQLTELPDHVAVELEFLGYLLLKEAELERRGDRDGAEIVRDAERKYLGEHLGGLVSTIGDALGDRHELYARIFGWCGALVAAECARHGVDVVASGGPAVKEDQDVSSCGALPVIQ